MNGAINKAHTDYSDRGKRDDCFRFLKNYGILLCGDDQRCFFDSEQARYIHANMERDSWDGKILRFDEDARIEELKKREKTSRAATPPSVEASGEDAVLRLLDQEVDVSHLSQDELSRRYRDLSAMSDLLADQLGELERERCRRIERELREVEAALREGEVVRDDLAAALEAAQQKHAASEERVRKLRERKQALESELEIPS